MRKAVGDRHSIKISNRGHLVGRFNGHHYGRIFMQCEEAFWAGDKGAGGILKDLITSDSMLMERKNIDAVQVQNKLRLAFTSNEDWVVPVGLEDERRFFVLECGDERRGDTEFFAAIDKQMTDGGLEAMVSFYQNYQPKHGWDWDILRTPPKTIWLLEQAAAAFEADDVFFRRMVENRGCDPILLPVGGEIAGFHMRSACTPLLPIDEGLLSPLTLSNDRTRQFLPFGLLRYHYEVFLAKNAGGPERQRLLSPHHIRDMMQRWLCADGGESPVKRIDGYNMAVRCFSIPMMEEITASLAAKGIMVEHTSEYKADDE